MESFLKSKNLNSGREIILNNNDHCKHRIPFIKLVLALHLLALPSGALSNSGAGTLQPYRDITINNTGAALSDCQMHYQAASSPRALTSDSSRAAQK
jgi:hypothetical protein